MISLFLESEMDKTDNSLDVAHLWNFGEPAFKVKL